MVPGAPGDVLVQVVIAGGQNVQARAGLVRDDDGMGIGKLLTKPRVHHRRIEGPAPGVHGVPAWTRPRASYGCGEHQVFSCSEGHTGIWC